MKRLHFEIVAATGTTIDVSDDIDIDNLPDSLFDKATDWVREHRPDWQIERWYWVDENGEEIIE